MGGKKALRVAQQLGQDSSDSCGPGGRCKRMTGQDMERRQASERNSPSQVLWQWCDMGWV